MIDLIPAPPFLRVYYALGTMLAVWYRYMAVPVLKECTT